MPAGTLQPARMCSLVPAWLVLVGDSGRRPAEDRPSWAALEVEDRPSWAAPEDRRPFEEAVGRAFSAEEDR